MITKHGQLDHVVVVSRVHTMVNKLRAAFGRVKSDIDAIRSSLSQWAVFLAGNDEALARRVAMLEKKIELLEFELKVLKE